MLLFAVGMIIWMANRYPEAVLRKQPVMLDMQQEWTAVAGEHNLGVFRNPDSLLTHELLLLKDDKERPLLYYADIQTPVCIDGLCKPVNIALYWNLVGNYVGFGLEQDQPLTKFDHELFTAADYEKLHHLLSDPNAVFQRRTLEELFDKNAVATQKKIEYQGIALDAVSGATVKEIKESVVEGALYSCYTLWHLAYGDASAVMEAHLKSIYSEALAQYFLQSEYEEYWLYALKQMDAAAMVKQAERLSEIMIAAKPMLRAYTLKKLPKAVFAGAEFSRKLYGAFSALDVNTRTLLLNNLSFAHSDALLLLSTQVESMSQNQLKTFLQYLDQHKAAVTPALKGNLERSSGNSQFTYRYLIADFLKTGQ